MNADDTDRKRSGELVIARDRVIGKLKIFVPEPGFDQCDQC
jgi:hypothetical protein